MNMAIGRIALCLMLLGCTLPSIAAVRELKFLHVLSANKFYVPDFNQTSKEFQAPKNFSYHYFHKNALDIPNSVKMALFNLGEQLRMKYNDFIGGLFSDEVMRMQTVAFPASIIAGELINAGLWPPVAEQIWKEDLLWQPVPFDYTPVDEDAVLLGGLCPNFAEDTRKVIAGHSNFSASHKLLLQHIKDKGKINVENPIDALMLYLAIDNSKALNQTQPRWIDEIYPDNMTNFTLMAYDLLSATTLQRRLNGGSLLKKITNDWKAHTNGTLHKERKLHVYSGDDRNLAGVMKNLNLTIREIPRAGDALIFELYKESKKYYVQVLHYAGDLKLTFPHKLPGCDIFCPVEKFQELVSDYLSVDELSLCGSTSKDTKDGKGSATSIAISNALLGFVTLILLYFCTKI